MVDVPASVWRNPGLETRQIWPLLKRLFNALADLGL